MYAYDRIANSSLVSLLIASYKYSEAHTKYMT